MATLKVLNKSSCSEHKNHKKTLQESALLKGRDKVHHMSEIAEVMTKTITASPFWRQPHVVLKM